MTPISFHVGVKAVIVQHGKLLILKRPDGIEGPYWDLPGGRMGEGESFEQTLVREVSEELPGTTNIQCGKLLHAYKRAKPIANQVQLILLFFATTATLPIPLQLSDEHSEWQWIDEQEFRYLHDAAVNPLLAHLLKAATA